MRVYKFGGASVATSEGIQNVARIVSQCQDDLMVVVSAMGKTTNALERVLDALMIDDMVLAQREWDSIIAYHEHILDQLSLPHEVIPIRTIPELADKNDYDFSYDQLVSTGELISSTIVQAYLAEGTSNHPYHNLWINYKITTNGGFSAKALSYLLKEMCKKTLVKTGIYPVIRAFGVEFLVNDVLPTIPFWSWRRWYLKRLKAKIGKGTFIMKKN